ncbi:MAG TPA: 3-isopropylmalate dehydrogenase, partial [Rubrivivax sp.]|nr:3-isopropylmalate dehydrogenase [Rubrivivax sp.]
MDSPKNPELTARNFPSAEEEVKGATAQPPVGLYAGAESAYRLAFTDTAFLLRDELRPVRMQLELLKPEMVQQELGIQSTIVVFGSARILAPDLAAQLLATAEAGSDEVLLKRARNQVAMSRY